jgi:hypothetical protein
MIHLYFGCSNLLLCWFTKKQLPTLISSKDQRSGRVRLLLISSSVNPSPQGNTLCQLTISPGTKREHAYMARQMDFCSWKPLNVRNHGYFLNPLTGFHVRLPFKKTKGQYTGPIYFGPSYCPKINPGKNSVDVFFMIGEMYYNPAVDDKVCLRQYDDIKWLRC